MPQTYSDYLLAPAAGLANTFVRLTNLRTNIQYIVPASTNASGRWDFTTGIPAGNYKVESGPASTGPWTLLDSGYTITTPYAFNISDYPGFKDDGTDTSQAILAAAADAATAPGGGEVIIPAPTKSSFYGITQTIPWYSKVAYVGPPRTELRWIAAAPLSDTPMFGNTAVLGAHLESPAMRGLTLNAASLAHVIPIQFDSVWRWFLENVYLQNANGGAGQYAWKLLSSVGNTFQNNTTMGVAVKLQVDSCQRGLQLNGNQNGTGVTNNYFYGTHLLCTDAWVDLQQFCDSNYWYGFDFGVAINSTGSFRGITLGDPVSDLGVHSERFWGGSIDFNTSGMAAAIGIVLNVCSATMFEQLFSGIGNVGGFTTFENGTLFSTVAGTGSYRIEWINQGAGPASNVTVVFEKSRRWLVGPSDVNGVGVLGASTGNGPTIQPVGFDTNVNLNVQGKGIGSVELASQMFNWWEAVGSPTGSELQLRPQGGDANINVQIQGKGTGLIRLGSQAFNWVDVIPNTTGNAVQVVANGGDANIPLHLNAKGTAEVRLGTQRANFPAFFGGSATQDIQIVAEGSDANISVQINGKGTFGVKLGAQLANYIQAIGNAATFAPVLSVQGLDTNITFQINGKGTGPVQLDSQFANFLQVQGAAAASEPALQAAGSDTNINLGLTPKGTGVVDFVYATVALGGGAAPTFGTIGGSGPGTAAQNSWLKININGTASFVPVWR